MSECCRRMLNEEEPDSPETSRDRRRRRIQIRRAAAAAASAAVASAVNRPAPEDERPIQTHSSAAAVGSSGVGDDVAVPGEDITAATETIFGKLSIPGRSRYMEDAVSVRTAIASPEISLCRPVHFFAVYDGHGGPHVADLCKERMHVIVSEEMERLRFTRGEESGGGGGERVAVEEEWWWRRVMKRSFARMDEEAMNICSCGSVGNQCGCQLVVSSVGGSTAVVALLTPDLIVVANVGDSRAVLRRDGTAVPLSHDHKPDRSDELARIEAAGGRVIFVNGARVEGILAMSRAIGDKYLKRYVISEPEITFTKRDPQDECLIIASDGMWDVLSNDLACRVAGECLREGRISSGSSVVATASTSARPHGEDERAQALYPSRSAFTAALLTRLALGRSSSDNISVVVVDLKRS